MTDSCKKFNLEAYRVLKVAKWINFDYFREKKRKKTKKNKKKFFLNFNFFDLYEVKISFKAIIWQGNTIEINITRQNESISLL